MRLLADLMFAVDGVTIGTLISWLIITLHPERR
jgi:hypothetical protein